MIGNVKVITNDRIDEKGGLSIIDHIKIFDPETKKVFVNKRA